MAAGISPDTAVLLLQAVAINLGFVCNVNGNYHIHPFDAHLRIAIVCMSKVMCFFSTTCYFGSQ
jgi:hypothetical protein